MISCARDVRAFVKLLRRWRLSDVTSRERRSEREGGGGGERRKRKRRRRVTRDTVGWMCLPGEQGRETPDRTGPESLAGF